MASTSIGSAGLSVTNTEVPSASRPVTMRWGRMGMLATPSCLRCDPNPRLVFLATRRTASSSYHDDTVFEMGFGYRRDAMKAARFTAPGTPLEIISVARPQPSPGEALVRVRAVGLCGSDVHITEGHTPTAFTPITLGHEIAGVVEVVGDGVGQHVAAGDHVFVNPMVGCLACRFCRAGEVNFCSRRKILGIQLDGALAEYVVAPVVNLTVMPEHVGFPETALIESAGTANL